MRQIHPNKATGPDGLSGAFYRQSWDFVGVDGIMCCVSILNNKESLGPLNETMILLISKVKNPRRVTDDRPISLCNVTYKIVSKAIVIRMKGILNVLVSEN